MEYVEQRNNGYYVAGTRVSLDSVVCAFLRGESPEGIAEAFPAVSLEQIFGSITYYLAHRAPIDAYLEQARTEFDRMRKAARQKHPLLYAKLDAKRETVSRRA